MKNKGFTYIEMVCALAVIVLLVSFTLYFIHPKFSWAKKNTFINQANNIVKAAINKYTSDANDDDEGIPDDVFIHNQINDEYFGRVCYSLKSLKGKYIDKLDKSFQGSVEICNLSTCGYKTKIWLSNDKYYLDGASDSISKKDLSGNVLGINRCGVTYD